MGLTLYQWQAYPSIRNIQFMLQGDGKAGENILISGREIKGLTFTSTEDGTGSALEAAHEPKADTAP